MTAYNHNIISSGQLHKILTLEGVA